MYAYVSYIDVHRQKKSNNYFNNNYFVQTCFVQRINSIFSKYQT